MESGELRCRILELYQGGLSTRQVSAQVSIPKSTVAALVKDSGIARSISLACQIRRPPKSKHWRTCREMARRIYRRKVGPIPAKWQIHHRDLDYTNNDPSNLEAVSLERHLEIHGSKLWGIR